MQLSIHGIHIFRHEVEGSPPLILSLRCFAFIVVLTGLKLKSTLQNCAFVQTLHFHDFKILTYGK